MARRNDHTREELKNMILAAATRLLEEEGAEGLSARKIAKEIGYTVGTLYNVFRNLDDIILHINGHTLDRLYGAMHEAVEKSDTPDEPIADLVRCYVDFYARHHALWSLVFEHKVADEDMPDWYLPKLDRVFAMLEKALTPYFDQPRAKALHQSTMIIWAGMYGICALSFAGGTETQARQMAYKLCEALITNYVRGAAYDTPGEYHYVEDAPLQDLLI